MIEINGRGLRAPPGIYTRSEWHLYSPDVSLKAAEVGKDSELGETRRDCR